MWTFRSESLERGAAVKIPVADLRVGDSYIHRTSDGASHRVTILKQLDNSLDRFGRSTLAFWATADDREGIVYFGDKGMVEIDYEDGFEGNLR